jgi:hypothetical protein
MKSHIATCAVCSQFARIHRSLDERLTAALPAESVSPGFRRSLAARIAGDVRSPWTESLPDMAHLIGCGGAIALCLFLLPWQPQTILLAGAAFTGVTYFMQATLRNALDNR